MSNRVKLVKNHHLDKGISTKAKFILDSVLSNNNGELGFNIDTMFSGSEVDTSDEAIYDLEKAAKELLTAGYTKVVFDEDSDFPFYEIINTLT